MWSCPLAGGGHVDCVCGCCGKALGVKPPMAASNTAMEQTLLDAQM
jgi:hypothetical protein